MLALINGSYLYGAGPSWAAEFQGRAPIATLRRGPNPGGPGCQVRRWVPLGTRSGRLALVGLVAKSGGGRNKARPMVSANPQGPTRGLAPSGSHPAICIA